MRRVFQWVAGALAFVMALALAAGWLVLQSPVFNEARQGYVAGLLTAATGQAIAIEGPVSALPGRLVSVSVERLSVPNAAWASADNLIEVGRLDLDFPICALWSCPFEISHWRVADAAAHFEVSASGEPSWQAAERADTRTPPSALPIEIFFAAETIADMTVRYTDHASAWFSEVHIEDFQQNYYDGTRFGDRSVSADGTLNGVPTTYRSTTIAGGEGGAPYRTDIVLDTAGVTVKTTATSTAWNFSTDLDAVVTADVSSIAETLKALNLSPEQAGTGEFRAEFTGDFDALKTPAFRLTAQSERGGTFNVHGSVDNLWALGGFDIGFGVTLPLKSGVPQVAKMLSELQLTGVSGSLVGDFDKFNIDALRMETNAFDQSVRNIGPIAFNNIKRDDGGLLVLPHFAVALGPEGAPWLSVEGRVGNLIALSDITMDGTFDVRPDAVLPHVPDPSALGQMEGTFRLEPRHGGTHLSALSLSVVGSTLVSGKIALTPNNDATNQGAPNQAAPSENASNNDAPNEAVSTESAPSEATLTVSADIGDYAAFARALGAPVVNAHNISVGAAIDVDDAAASVRMRLHVDDSQALGKLSIAEGGSRTRLDGVVSLPRLKVADVAHMVQVGHSLFTVVREQQVLPDVGKALPGLLAGGLDAHVSILSDDVLTRRQDIKNLRADVTIERGLLTLDPLAFDLLDGSFQARLSTNTAERGDPLHIEGALENVELSRLLPETATGVSVSGNLSGTYILRAVPDTWGSIASSLTGELTMALSGGRVGSNAIDLAGLGPLKFMVSKAARRDFSQIRCAVGEIRFFDGEGLVSDAALETDFIHASIDGALNLPQNTIDMVVAPRPLDRPAALPYIPAKVTGALNAPTVTPMPGEYRLPSAERTPVTAADEARADARKSACERAAAAHPAKTQ